MSISLEWYKYSQDQYVLEIVRCGDTTLHLIWYTLSHQVSHFIFIIQPERYIYYALTETQLCLVVYFDSLNTLYDNMWLWSNDLYLLSFKWNLLLLLLWIEVLHTFVFHINMHLDNLHTYVWMANYQILAAKNCLTQNKLTRLTPRKIKEIYREGKVDYPWLRLKMGSYLN